MAGDLTIPGELSILHGPAPASSSALVFLEAQGSPSTARTYRAALGRLASLAGASAPIEAIPWHLLRYEHAARLKGALILADLAPSTVNLHLTVLRGVMRTAWRMGMVSAEDYHRVASIEGVRGSQLPTGRALRGVELGALFAACSGPRLIDARDAAIVSLLAGAGLRRAEAAALDRGDLAPPLVAVRRGKGRRGREAAMPPSAWARVMRWCEVSYRAPSDIPGRLLGDLPLLVRLPKSGKITIDRLSPKGLRLAVSRRAAAAGIGEVTAHDLRRTMVTGWLEAGVDTITVQRAAGHASTDTTARYDKRRTSALVQAAALVPFPGVE